jgi:EAL domain-containing protein (putative c-di-GMP-specific phosphodiesterase class I)/GGDEF domain-containing protein
MTMTLRLALLLAAVLLTALLGSAWLHTAALRSAYVAQLEVRNADAAASLALALSQQRGDRAALETVATAQAALGHYRLLQLRAPDGQLLFQRQGGNPAVEVPAWFVAALPLVAPPGRAMVSDGWQPLGELWVESHADWAHEALWAACVRTALLLGGLGLVAATLAAVLLRGWQRPLQATMAQAEALEQGRFVTATEPAWPELRQLTRSMNSMVQRLRGVFDAQAEQVALLQRQAMTDAVSGLPRREVFVGRLQDLLADTGAPMATLLLLRARRLETANRRLGHDGTDRLLGAVADVLLTYVSRVPGSFAGRLNGSDFALCLPAPGVARETGESLLAALMASPLARTGGVEWVAGAVDGVRGGGASAALAAADAALAEAEAEPGSTVVVSLPADFVADPGGARAWRAQIAAALADKRVQLGQFPVRDAQGRLLHLECPLRVQLVPGAEFHAARRWLALAARSRLLPEVDLAAVDLALAAIAADGLARGVHVAPASLAAPGFDAALQQRLQAAPAAAHKLWLDLAEDMPRALAQPLREAVAAWRGCGARVGIEHAGASPQALAALQGLGLDYVKVAARHLRGVADDEAVRDYARSLLALLRGLGATALAEGIEDPRDLTALWQLGFDGATGAAVAALGPGD